MEEIVEAAREARECLIPKKSNVRYKSAYDAFKEWQANKRIVVVSEDVILVYVKELSEKLAPPTVWSFYSMVKSMLQLKEGINIGDYKSVGFFLKQLSKGYKSKQAKVFNECEIQRFLDEAADEQYLAFKVIVVLGILGACRCQELCDMELENLKDIGETFLVSIPLDNKTDVCRSFTVSGKYYDIVKKYIKLRPKDFTNGRLLLNYRNGRCLRQVIGKNSISKIPEKVANFLGLPDAKLYTGHSLRRSSATFVVNGGGHMLDVKRQGGWKSASVAERYMEESVVTKRRNESFITGVLEKEVSSRRKIFDERIRVQNVTGKKKVELVFDSDDEDSCEEVLGEYELFEGSDKIVISQCVGLAENGVGERMNRGGFFNVGDVLKKVKNGCVKKNMLPRTETLSRREKNVDDSCNKGKKNFVCDFSVDGLIDMFCESEEGAEEIRNGGGVVNEDDVLEKEKNGCVKKNMLVRTETLSRREKNVDDRCDKGKKDFVCDFSVDGLTDLFCESEEGVEEIRNGVGLVDESDVFEKEENGHVKENVLRRTGKNVGDGSDKGGKKIVSDFGLDFDFDLKGIGTGKECDIFEEKNLKLDDDDVDDGDDWWVTPVVRELQCSPSMKRKVVPKISESSKVLRNIMPGNVNFVNCHNMNIFFK